MNIKVYTRSPMDENNDSELTGPTHWRRIRLE